LPPRWSSTAHWTRVESGPTASTRPPWRGCGECHGEQAEDVELYAEQLLRWQAGRLDGGQGQVIERLSSQVERWRREVAATLGLADELKDQTIEALMRKSDLELGIEALFGQKPRRRRRARSKEL